MIKPPKADKVPEVPKRKEVLKAEEEFAKAEENLKAAPEDKPEEAGEEKVAPSLEQAPVEPPKAEQPKTEAKAEEKAEDLGTKYEELVKKKGFKNQEDLANAYENLEKRASRVENMAREALQKVNEKAKEPLKEVDEEQEQALGILRNTVQEVVQEVVRNELTPIRVEQDRKYVDQRIAEVQAKFPWFKGQVVQDAVAMVARGEARSLEDAAKVLTFDIAIQNASHEAAKEEKVMEKKSAYAESAGEAATSKEVDYSSMTLEELEEVLPKAGTFVDHKGHLRRA